MSSMIYSPKSAREHSFGVKDPTLPMMGIMLTCGNKQHISSMSISLRLLDKEHQWEVYFSSMYLQMTSGWDEVKQSVHLAVPELGITLDTRLFSQNVVVLTTYGQWVG